MAMAAAQRGLPRLVVPRANAREAAVVREVAVYGVDTLAEAAARAARWPSTGSAP
jgi:magnesium chelatase family protein